MEKSGDEHDDLGLQIPLAALLSQFDCPICYEQLKSCVMTPCGHNFCQACIAECLNRKHACPLCNKECTVKQCYANLQLDNLLTSVVAEKEKASKKYFEDLFKKSGEYAAAPTAAAVPASAVEPESKKHFSPIESLFQKHMRRTLAEFTQYNATLQERRDRAVQHIRDVYVDKMARAKSTADAQHNGAAPRSALEAVLGPLERDMSAEIAVVRESFDKSVSSLLQSFDAHMTRAAPSMAALPVLVSAVVEASQTLVAGITIQPTDTLKEVRAAVVERLAAQGNPVVSFNERCLFMLQRACDAPGQLQILDEGTPLGMLKIEPASRLVWCGDVKLKSDVPALCFSVTYKKDGKEAVDYYSCKQCGISWVCTNCAKHCHAGHEVKLYLKAHVPTWACCYCAKKTKCALLGK